MHKQISIQKLSFTHTLRKKILIDIDRRNNLKGNNNNNNNNKPLSVTIII